MKINRLKFKASFFCSKVTKTGNIDPGLRQKNAISFKSFLTIPIILFIL